MWWPKWKSEEPATGLPMRWCYWDIFDSQLLIRLYIRRSKCERNKGMNMNWPRALDMSEKEKKKTECNRMLLSDLILIMNKLNCEDEEETRRKATGTVWQCGGALERNRMKQYTNLFALTCNSTHSFSLLFALGFTLFHLGFVDRTSKSLSANQKGETDGQQNALKYDLCLILFEIRLD